MDRTLITAKRPNRRRQERNFKAWQRFSPDGVTCPYCPHANESHLCTAGQPNFYRPATEEEMSDHRVTLYRHNTPGGGSVLVRRMTVSRHAETVMAFCGSCAEAAQTAQVLCYQRSRAIGEVVGITQDATTRAA